MIKSRFVALQVHIDHFHIKTVTSRKNTESKSTRRDTDILQAERILITPYYTKNPPTETHNARDTQPEIIHQ